MFCFQSQNSFCIVISCLSGDRGSAVVKVLCYKLESRWFDPSWCHCIFQWHKILPIALWPWGRLSLQQKWVPGAFPGSKGGPCVRLTTLPPSCAVVTKYGNLNFLERSGLPQAVTGLLYLFNIVSHSVQCGQSGWCHCIEEPSREWAEQFGIFILIICDPWKVIN